MDKITPSEIIAYKRKEFTVDVSQIERFVISENP